MKIRSAFGRLRPSKKTFGKIGLFLVFGLFIWNFQISTEINFIDNENVASINIRSSVAEANFKDFVRDSWNWTVYAVTNPLGYAKHTAGAVVNETVKPVLWAFNWLLYGVLWLLSTLLLVSGALLDMVLKEELFREVIDDNLYTLWIFVRDFINLFFMLALLFAAFATIFQVEKYHLKKMIVLLVVMALLVNFSYAITLFVIDFSNSAMYYFVDSMHRVAGHQNSEFVSSSAILNGITGFTDIQKAVPEGSTDSTQEILLLIVFTFILFITLLAIAINLLIRLVAFLILLVFSPVGFALAFFPATKKISNDWWSSLFKYAFMGPIMAFFLLMAIVILDSRPISPSDIIGDSEKTKLGGILNLIFAVSFLWMGLVSSLKFGGMASGSAMSFAKATGNKIRGYTQKGAWGLTKMGGRGIDMATRHNISGTAGAIKMGWNKLGENYKEASKRRATQTAADFGLRGANEQLVRDLRKKWKEEGISNEDLNRLGERGTTAERMAVALERVENDRFDDNPDDAMRQYRNAVTAIGNHQVYGPQFLREARKKNIDLVMRHRVENNTDPSVTETQIIREELERLSPEQWADQNIPRMVNNNTPNNRIIVSEGRAVIGNYSPRGQENVTRNMRGAKRVAGSNAANAGAGLWA